MHVLTISSGPAALDFFFAPSSSFDFLSSLSAVTPLKIKIMFHTGGTGSADILWFIGVDECRLFNALRYNWSSLA